MDQPDLPTRRQMADFFSSPEWAYLKTLWEQVAHQTEKSLVVSQDPSSQIWALGQLSGRLNTLKHMTSKAFETDVIGRLPANEGG